MALGHGSKKSISCEQGVTPPLNSEVSNANTKTCISLIFVTQYIQINLCQSCGVV